MSRLARPTKIQMPCGYIWLDLITMQAMAHLQKNLDLAQKKLSSMLACLILWPRVDCNIVACWHNNSMFHGISGRIVKCFVLPRRSHARSFVTSYQCQPELCSMKKPTVQITTGTATNAGEEARYLTKPDDIEENEIARQAKHGLPLALPWGRKPVRLGTTLHSSLLSTENPWSEETPFVLSDLYMLPKELHFEYGTNSTFKKLSTSKESETGDHLSLGFGVGVGVPFLASASVKGTFDQHIQENKDSEKISLNASCRAGTIELQRQPRLTREAIVEIKYGGGYEGFCERWGDYYIAGYRLGGDTGILMSASGHSREQIDKYGVTATVEVCFVEVSKHWEKDFRKFSAGRQVRLLGYDAIDDMHWKRFSAAGDDVKEMVEWARGDPAADVNSLRADTDAIMTRSENLLERVNDVLSKHGYRNGESLTFVQCEELVTQGIVVELLLEPMSRMRDVIRWRMETNII